MLSCASLPLLLVISTAQTTNQLLAFAQGALFREFGIYQSNVEPGGIRTKFTANAQRPDMTKIPPEYHPYLQSTIAAYTVRLVAL